MRATALAQMSVDGATAQVVTALRARDIRAIVLKGPALARWLYPDAALRRYGDIDLLVGPAEFESAESVLAELGYRRETPSLRRSEEEWHERHWRRGAPWPAMVDLHRGLLWAGIDAAAAWELLTSDTRCLDLGGTRVEVLGEPARALVVALHAASHGVAAHPMVDLALAVESLDVAVWEGADDLATRLDARATFGFGLRLVPAGAALADRLGCPRGVSAAVRLRRHGPPTAWGFVRLGRERSVRARARLVIAEVFPSPAATRMWHPVARRGALGLAAAYLLRPFWLAWMAPRGLLAWWRATREARG